MKDFVARLGSHAVELARLHAAMGDQASEDGFGEMSNHHTGAAQEYAALASTCLECAKTVGDDMEKAAVPAASKATPEISFDHFLRIQGE